MPDSLKSFGLPRLVAIAGVTIGVAGALVAIMLHLGAPPMTVLYADLPYEDAQPVIDKLEQSDIHYELRGGRARATILVPKSDAMKLRMTMAENGLPANGTVGYEIFDKEDALGATSFQQNINRLRALEGELERTIASLDGVRAARVHLVLPERELFSHEQKQPSASIVVDAPRGLPSNSVRAIQNLVASAVQDLKPNRVTVLDNTGALLAAAEDENDPTGAVASEMAQQRTASTEARIRKSVEDILAPVIGPDRVRVQVAAQMNFNRVSETAEIYDPDGQVVLSSVTQEEAGQSTDPADNNAVSVGQNLPGADLGLSGNSGGAATTSNQKTTETTNYQISKTVRNKVQEAGAIERLSVAIAVDGVYTTDAATGESTYAPRTDEEMARIETLVKSAIGFDAKRGDQVKVVNMKFNRTPTDFKPVEEPTASPGLTKDDFMRIAEIAVLGILGVILALFVLRPMLKPGTPGKLPAPQQLASLPPGADAQAHMQLPAEERQRALPPPENADNPLHQHIDYARVQGKMKAGSVKELSELVKENTDESTAVLRNWISGAA